MSAFDPFSWGEVDETKLVQVSSPHELAKVPHGGLIYGLDEDGNRFTQISRGYDAVTWGVAMKEFPGTRYYVTGVAR